MSAFRADSRAHRSPAELKRILIGEQAVLRARAARAKHLQDTAHCDGHEKFCTSQSSEHQQPARHTWSAAELVKIQRGREAAQRMRSSTTLRKSCRSLRDSCSWAQSSVTGDDSTAECKVFLKHDVHIIKKDLQRYEESVSCLDSPRSLVSYSSSSRGKQSGQHSSRLQQTSAALVSACATQGSNP